ncbi:PAS domain S-box-containing protein [Krasilnikovia cinnamomea]|uniref:histidine kinase n=1 Tax=Krasilnikovia cinnamomea TaxID=349313 RepID=A0A4Q7ZNT6_9ACTN|nr:PAS domain S-box-containing protein [Krasilnikovia cinnamomea]
MAVVRQQAQAGAVGDHARRTSAPSDGAGETPAGGGYDAERAAFRASPVAMAILDEDDRLTEVNPAFCRLLGRDPADLLGHGCWTLTHPDDLGVREDAHATADDPAAAVCYEQRLLRPDGAGVACKVTLVPLEGPQGRRHQLAQVEDLTGRHQDAARATRHTEILLATINVQRAVTAAAHDRAEVLEVVAAQAVQAFPVADGAVVELVHGDSLDYVAAAGTLVVHLGLRLPIEGSLSGVAMSQRSTVLCRDSETDPRVNREACRAVGLRSMCVAPLFSGDRPIGVLKISSAEVDAFDDGDVYQLELLAGSLSAALRHADDYARNATLLSERTVALSALEASERRFRVAFDNSPLGMVLTSLQPDTMGTFLQANPAMAAITGYPVEQLAGMRVSDLQHPDDLEVSLPVLARLAAGEIETANLEARYRHADGHDLWVRIRTAVAHDERIRPRYLVSQIEDITAARAAQAQLRRQARLLELIPAAVIARDLDGTIRWWNAGAEATYGWPASAATGKLTHRLLATAFPDGGAVAEQADILRRDRMWDGELEHLTADGRTITVLSRQVVQDAVDGASTVLEINTDITAARAAQRAMHQSEQRFRAQFTHSAVGQIVRALDGTLLDVNPAFAAMLGRTADELIGSPTDLLLHPDTAADMRHKIADLFGGDHDAYSHEGQVRHADGGWVDVEATVSLVRDTDGRPLHLIGVFVDISARKAAEHARDAAAAELACRNTELEAANRLKLDLIGMLGHEIGTPLTSILGCAEVAADGWSDLPDEHKHRLVESVHRNARRLDTIVREVLALVTVEAGRLTAHPQRVDVREHLRAAILHVPGAQPPDIDCPDGLRATVQPGHLDQILANLLSNADKYGGGATRITARRLGGQVEIRVEDRGPGVPERFRPHLFDRFSRADSTAGSVKGTGLGLYIVRELARANRGDIEYAPGDDTGSVFLVRLPADG